MFKILRPNAVQYQGTGYGGHGDPGLGVEDVVPDNENSGGPLFDMGLTMSAPTKKKFASSGLHLIDD